MNIEDLIADCVTITFKRSNFLYTDEDAELQIVSMCDVLNRIFCDVKTLDIVHDIGIVYKHKSEEIAQILNPQKLVAQLKKIELKFGYSRNSFLGLLFQQQLRKSIVTKMKCNFDFHNYFCTFEKKCKDLNFVLIQIQDLNLQLQKILLHSDLTNLHSITKLSTFVQSAAVDAVSAAATAAASGCLPVQAAAAAAAAAGIPASHVDSADAGQAVVSDGSAVNDSSVPALVISAAGTPAPAPVSFTDGIAEYLNQQRSSIRVTLADGLENLFGESSNAYELCIIFPQKPSSSAKECNLTKKSVLAKSYLKLFEQARLRKAFSTISACTLTCFNFLNCAIVIARVPKIESTQGFDRSQYLSASQVRVSQDLLSKSVVLEKDPSSKVQSISIGKILQNCDIQSECFGIKLSLQQESVKSAVNLPDLDHIYSNDMNAIFEYLNRNCATGDQPITDARVTVANLYKFFEFKDKKLRSS